MSGFRFRRQHPIGPFFADFFCASKRLVVELDGGQHAERVEKDERRTRYLRSKNIDVIRFWNNDVLLTTDAVLEQIFDALSARVLPVSERFVEEEGPSPRPSP